MNLAASGQPQIATAAQLLIPPVMLCDTLNDGWGRGIGMGLDHVDRATKQLGGGRRIAVGRGVNDGERRIGPTSSPIRRTSARPTRGSIGSVTRWRPPPRPTTASPSARASIAATAPARSRCTAWRTGAWVGDGAVARAGPPGRRAGLPCGRSAPPPRPSRARTAAAAAGARSSNTPPREVRGKLQAHLAQT